MVEKVQYQLKRDDLPENAKNEGERIKQDFDDEPSMAIAIRENDEKLFTIQGMK